MKKFRLAGILIELLYHMQVLRAPLRYFLETTFKPCFVVLLNIWFSIHKLLLNLFEHRLSLIFELNLLPLQFLDWSILFLS